MNSKMKKWKTKKKTKTKKKERRMEERGYIECPTSKTPLAHTTCCRMVNWSAFAAQCSSELIHPWTPSQNIIFMEVDDSFKCQPTDTCGDTFMGIYIYVKPSRRPACTVRGGLDQSMSDIEWETVIYRWAIWATPRSHWTRSPLVVTY